MYYSCLFLSLKVSSIFRNSKSIVNRLRMVKYCFSISPAWTPLLLRSKFPPFVIIFLFLFINLTTYFLLTIICLYILFYFCKFYLILILFTHFFSFSVHIFFFSYPCCLIIFWSLFYFLRLSSILSWWVSVQFCWVGQVFVWRRSLEIKLARYCFLHIWDLKINFFWLT